MIFSFYEILRFSEEFLSWKKNNKEAYLSHFYCRVNGCFQRDSPWEVGFYIRKKDQLVTFKVRKKGKIEIKFSQQIFKKKEEIIEKLDLEKVKIGFSKVKEIFQKVKRENFPQETLLKGFLILQNLQKRNIWNISFITSSFSIFNLKIEANKGEVISSQLISFLKNN